MRLGSELGSIFMRCKVLNVVALGRSTFTKLCSEQMSSSLSLLTFFCLLWGASKEALGNKAVKRSLHSDLFQMDVLGAD